MWAWALKLGLGAAMVLVIQLLARSRHYYVAGLAPLFPTLGLISHFIVGSERTPAELRQTLLFSMAGMLPYFAYLGALYLLVERVKLGWALLGALACWLIAAWLLILIWQPA